ncbi:MAG: hypothetical protein K2K69_01980, partial [Muribaculaceae bacterium]|nr:hypothetical protein [Muribaculaceae bacterium]
MRNLADVQPQTQVNFIQVFPTLEDGCDIALLKIYVEGNWVDFSLSDTYYNPFEDVVQVAQEISSAEDISQGVITENENSFSNVDYRIEWSVQVFVDRLNKIKTSIYSRLNNVLTESE